MSVRAAAPRVFPTFEGSRLGMGLAYGQFKKRSQARRRPGCCFERAALKVRKSFC